MAEGTARSTGMFPRRAAWCDVETMIPDDGSCNKFPHLTSIRYSNGGAAGGTTGTDVQFVAYFSEDAAGSVDVVDCTSDEVIVTLSADKAIKGKAIAVRAGYELDGIVDADGNPSPLDTFKRTTASLTAGTARVFVF